MYFRITYPSTSVPFSSFEQNNDASDFKADIVLGFLFADFVTYKIINNFEKMLENFFVSVSNMF